MIYLIGWGVAYFALMLMAATRYKGSFFILVGLMFYASVAFLRGNVGTDTETYERMLLDFAGGYSWDGREPGFVMLCIFLLSWLPSIEIAVRAIAVVMFSMLGFVVVRANNDERFFILVYLLPVFAYQYSMNMLRIGLAAIVVLYSVQLMRRTGRAESLRTGAAALLFHYSAMFSLAYLYFSQRPWLRFSSVLGGAAIMLVAIVITAAAENYFLLKVSGYTTFKSPGMLSGLRLIIPCVVLVVALAFSSLPSDEKVKHAVLTLSFLAVGWGIAQFSYAGLRLIDLVAFVSPLAMLATYSRLGMALDLKFKSGLLLAGAIAVAGIYRGFSMGAGKPTSFIPYEVWL